MQQKEKQREQQTNELKELETKTREEKQAVSELKADKKTELDKIDKAMEKSQDQVSEYTKKALEAENQVEALLQKKQDEIDREMAAGGGKFGGRATTMRNNRTWLAVKRWRRTYFFGIWWQKKSDCRCQHIS